MCDSIQRVTLKKKKVEKEQLGSLTPGGFSISGESFPMEQKFIVKSEIEKFDRILTRFSQNLLGSKIRKISGKFRKKITEYFSKF